MGCRLSCMPVATMTYFDRDQTCDADHGYDGTITADDIALRVSADADGEDALANAMAFSRALSAAVGRG